MRRDVRTALVCAMLLLCSSTALAGEDPAKSEPEAQAPPPTKLESRVFQIKNRSAIAIQQVLEPLRSQTRGTVIAANDEARAIAVRDLPENLAAIDEAIRRLDVGPQPTSAMSTADVEVRLYILLLDEKSSTTSAAPEIASVASQLVRTVGAHGFSALAPIVQRTRVDGQSGIGSIGQIASGEFSGSYSVATDGLWQRVGPANETRVDIGRLRFDLKAAGGDAHLASSVSVRLGEPAVVGVASLAQGRSVALVLVVEAAGK